MMRCGAQEVPAVLPSRLTAAGFSEAEVESNGDRFRFRARR